MGAAPSKMEEDKGLQLCRERKKFVKQALDGRCSLAVTHITYVDSLREVGTSLRMFIEGSSSLFTSTTATPQPLPLTETSLSHFSFSPSPSPHDGPIQYQANHMKSRVPFSKKVVEVLPMPVLASVTSSATFQNNNTPHSTAERSPETPLWDYFGHSHPIDNHLSSYEGLDDTTRLGKEEGVPDLDDDDNDEEEDKHSSSFDEPEDEFDEPSTEFLHNGEKSNNLDMSPSNAHLKDDENKAAETTTPHPPKDLFSSMKDIEYLFIKAADSGKGVPRMLEANKFHFRPIFPGKDSGSMALMMVKACFSCGKDDPIHVQEEPVQNTVNYLTWHRTASSRSSSSRFTHGTNSLDEREDFNDSLLGNCMISGSHASTLDRLFAWERKLYDEVKASQIIRGQYDAKCKLLRSLESTDESKTKIDKVRAVVKDLHSRIRVAIHRIDTISKKIEELRDSELQPQLDELIDGLRRMWEVMFECHKLQLDAISTAYNKGNHKSSDLHRNAIHLKAQLESLSWSFTKWVSAQKTYLQALNNWLFKCIPLQEKSTKRRRRREGPPIRNFGPPMYTTVEVWLELIGTLPEKALQDSIKVLASEINRFVPHHEKNQDKGRDGNNSDTHEVSEDHVHEFDRFQQSLIGFLSQLSVFADSSANMLIKLQKDIQDSKNNYNRKMSIS
ncbi:protein ROLLING AND ERECT LEAF 2 [Impatiens glandulifera]|uniref:protein ROLLING AND ERECT LEAF 2 n=1 Tax=Impatiens glandulifera TaxID=253017 RepID=UPI001FB07CFA|nr:protein ROLLING AND ERECT LEAF 2 [Impatiens glandulifera]